MGARMKCLLFLALALATSVAQADGLVWVLEGERNKVYLAGSVHLLKRDDAVLPQAFDKAYADADALVMEIDLDDLDPAEAATWMLQRGTFQDGATLRETLGEARHRRVADAANQLGLPIEGVQQFEPWAVALTLAQLAYARAGFDTESGVEKQLERRARTDRKEITGLETIAEQLSLLDALSLEEQASFLDQTVGELDEIEEETRALFSAWRAGDAERLAKVLTEDFEQFPKLYTTLVRDRNVRWMPQIERLLDDDRDYLVVVGALHLVGPEGLVELARARKLKPKPLR
jgi:uncharacterized protein